jgi:hypothetical protein
MTARLVTYSNTLLILADDYMIALISSYGLLPLRNEKHAIVGTDETLSDNEIW